MFEKLPQTHFQNCHQAIFSKFHLLLRDANSKPGRSQTLELLSNCVMMIESSPSKFHLLIRDANSYLSKGMQERSILSGGNLDLISIPLARLLNPAPQFPTTPHAPPPGMRGWIIRGAAPIGDPHPQIWRNRFFRELGWDPSPPHFLEDSDFDSREGLEDPWHPPP